MSKKEIKKIGNKLKLYLVLHHIDIFNYLGIESKYIDNISFCNSCKITDKCEKNKDIKRYWSDIDFKIYKCNRKNINKMVLENQKRYRCVEWIKNV